VITSSSLREFAKESHESAKYYESEVTAARFELAKHVDRIVMWGMRVLGEMKSWEGLSKSYVKERVAAIELGFAEKRG
jgi:hypothetical protein